MELIKNNSVGVKSEAVVGKYYLTDLFGRPSTGVHCTSHQLAGRAHVSRRQHRREENNKNYGNILRLTVHKNVFSPFPFTGLRFWKVQLYAGVPTLFLIITAAESNKTG